ncbi:hypothetical protein D0962_06450 [Leptolyngbyaceae cyanobacterium CCMR0082]|uniref:LSDAT prokaryote domain-containing protein n=2 Tax=Adonisia turfae TaxID=2950184 RepID=A0A6M0S2Z4_9CYAN|nr:hypothetical protein [Adonisia turfae]NEZ60049.1 hypothetical protein [Adonisia turfae CCMR0081]NEZ62423.1 hypothetical protein [Adonisia turfae CCMR0082]
MPRTSADELVEHTFSNGQLAKILKVADDTGYEKALSLVGLAGPRPTLLVIGGASNMTAESQAKLLQFFNDTLATLSERIGITVLDGGTDAGVIHMMGQARHYVSGQFNLIGVAPLNRVIFPVGTTPPPPPDDSNYPPVELEPHHTHFFLVPGENWGSESRWLARFSSVLAGHFPSMTLLINGGQVSLQDLRLNLELGRHVTIIAGSGRLADAVANTISGVMPSEDETIQNLVDNYYPKQLSVFNLLSSSLDDLKTQLDTYFDS